MKGRTGQTLILSWWLALVSTIIVSTIIVSTIISGCASDPDPSCRPDVAAGRIQGRVSTGGDVSSMVVSATRIPDDQQALATLETKTDSAGAYVLDVPAGRYLVSLRVGTYRTIYDYSAAGLRYGEAPGDTLQVDPGTSPVVIDFHLGSIRAHMDLPVLADGLPFEVVLHRQGVAAADRWRTYVDGASTTVGDAAADIDIPGVLPGLYRVEVVLDRQYSLCDCPLEGEHFWMPGTRDSSDSPWIDVPADGSVQVNGRVDTDPAGIEGEIGGAWRELGLHPPAIALYTPDSLVVRGFHEVSADGAYAASMFLAGPVKLCVEHDGVYRWIGGDGFASARVFTLENGHAISGADLTESALLLETTQSDLWLGQPTLSVFDRATMAPVGVIRYAERRGGVYVVPNLRPGSFVLRIDPDQPGDIPWRPQWYDRATGPESGREIVIGPEGTIVRIPVTLERGGRIQGVARDEGRDREFLFYLTRADDPTRWALGFGHPSGRDFDLVGIPDGDWKLGAWPRIPGQYPALAPANTTWYPGTTDWSAAGVISVRGAGSITGLEIVVASR